jgi:hypothetical protein
MNRLMLGAGALGIAGLSLVSIYLNFQFGLQFGGLLFGAASACLDLVKMALPVAFMAACMARGRSLVLRMCAGILFALIWVLVTAVSLQSAGGAALLRRMDGNGSRTALMEQRQRLSAERQRLAARNPWTPQIEQYRAQPSAAINAQIAAFKNAWQWEASRHCEHARGRSTRRYCQLFRTMEAAAEVAAGREQDARRLDEIDKKLASLPVIAEADPLSKAVADSVNIDQKWVLYTWAGLLALLLEIVPNIGPALLILAFRLAKDEAKEPVATQVATEKPAGQDRAGQARTVAATLAAGGQDDEMDKQKAPASQPDSRVVDFGRYAASLASRRPSLATSSALPGRDIILAATKKLGPGQYTLDEIMAAVQEVAAASGASPPRKNGLGKVLTGLGHIQVNALQPEVRGYEPAGCS